MRLAPFSVIVTRLVTAGLSCEYVATTVCTVDNSGSATSFCTNDGVCREVEGSGCVCPFGFVGERCEFVQETTLPVTTTTGAKTTTTGATAATMGATTTTEETTTTGVTTTTSTTTTTTTRATTKTGAATMTMEATTASGAMSTSSSNSTGFEQCADGHRCTNGCVCIENPYDVDSFYCDCDATLPAIGLVTAGLSCEYVATAFCTTDNDISMTSFCTNGGVCKESAGVDDAHLGCDCLVDFEGEHCQYIKGTTMPSNTPTTVVTSGTARKGAIGMPLLLIVLVILAFRH